MKKILMSFLVLLCAGLFLACNRSDARGLFKEQPTKMVTLLYDVTDNMSVRPNSDEIVRMYDFRNEDLYNGYELRIRRLSMVNLTAIIDFGVPIQSKLTGDEIKRIMLIKGFRKNVKDRINTISQEKTQEEAHSVIYRTVAQELNHLASMKADSKICIIYSDLIENSEDANFYAPAGLAELKSTPQSVISRLQKTLPLQNLGSIKVFIVYSPKSYEEERRFNYVISMYKTMLESKGAEVIVGANLITN